MNERKIYTVSALTRLIKNTLEQTYPEVWVRGEVSNFKTYSSGHMYFSLKDAEAQIYAIIFYPITQNIRFELKDGLEVIAYGRVSVYAKRGEYRLIITYIEPVGIGALQLAFEQLKEKLAKEGLFDPSRKKPIPLLPQRIGVVTSPDGAAIRDILTVINRRFANVEILIYPVRVQGDEAKYDIVEAIKYLNEKYYGYLDVILIGRGGGSLEDLWSFNEEIVARAIAESRIPTISCVGHEIDFTIADFVADLRAPTPSAAAELVVKDKMELSEKLATLMNRLKLSVEHTIKNFDQRLQHILSSRVFVQPLAFIEEKMQQLDDLFEKIMSDISHILDLKEKDLKLFSEKLSVLSPLNILSRGYAIVRKLPENKVIKDTQEIELGDSVKINLFRGELVSTITEKKI